jgi:hypothetical protein
LLTWKDEKNKIVNDGILENVLFLIKKVIIKIILKEK